MVKVLLADDDADLLDLLTYALRREGYSVLGAADGRQALERWEADAPDLVVLDGAMPHVDGFEVCRRIRHESKVPIMMLTGRNMESDIVRGLDVGADDYVTKPFGMAQLTARMRALLRRARTDNYRLPVTEIVVGDLRLDLDAHQVTRGDEVVQLTLREFRILHLLMMNQGRVIPYARLLAHGWGYHDETSSALLKTHVSHLRKKLKLGSDGPGSIRTILGVGYAFKAAEQGVTGGPSVPAGSRANR